MAPRTSLARPAPQPAATASAATSTLTPLALAAILLGPLLSMIDFFIVNVALPQIQSDLQTTTATLELVVAGYGIAYALLLVVGGRLGDAYGRRRLFLAGMASFTLASLLCGLAPSADYLVAARVVQGAAAAFMVPQVLATIQATTVGAARSRAIGIYGAAGGLAAVVGQLLGGVLVDANLAGTGWRPIFLVNVPIGLLGLLVASRVLPDSRSSAPARHDALGTVLLGAVVLALLLPLTEGRALGWPVWTWVCLAIAPLLAAVVIMTARRLEGRGGAPLVPPSLIRLRSVRNGLLLGVPFFIGFGAFMFVYAVTVQGGLSWTPLQAGLALTPMGLAFLVTSVLSSRLVARFGRTSVTVGALLQGLGLLMLLAPLLQSWPDVSAVELLPGMLVAGAGQGMVMSTLFRVVLSEVPPQRAGVGSGVLMTAQQLSLSLGVATLGTLFLTLADEGGDSVRTGFAVVIAVQVVVAGVIAAGSRRLPA